MTVKADVDASIARCLAATEPKVPAVPADCNMNSDEKAKLVKYAHWGPCSVESKNCPCSYTPCTGGEYAQADSFWAKKPYTDGAGKVGAQYCTSQNCKNGAVAALICYVYPK